MPRHNKKNKAHFRNGGATWLVEVLLSVAEAEAIYGASSVAGWYEFSYTQKSAVERLLGREIVKAENGVIVANRPKSQDAKLRATVMQTDTKTLKLLDLLADTPHRFRIAFDTSDATKVQLFGFRNAFVVGDWTMEGEDGKDRMIDVEVHASRDDAGNPPMIFDDVLSADETGWPTGLAEFKTDATP